MNLLERYFQQYPDSVPSQNDLDFRERDCRAREGEHRLAEARRQAKREHPSERQLGGGGDDYQSETVQKVVRAELEAFRREIARELPETVWALVDSICDKRKVTSGSTE